MTDEPNTRLVILCQPSRESPAATRDHSVYLSTSKQLRRVTARADYKTTLTDAGVGEIRERGFRERRVSALRSRRPLRKREF